MPGAQWLAGTAVSHTRVSLLHARVRVYVRVCTHAYHEGNENAVHSVTSISHLIIADVILPALLPLPKWLRRSPPPSAAESAVNTETIGSKGQLDFRRVVYVLHRRKREKFRFDISKFRKFPDSGGIFILSI